MKINSLQIENVKRVKAVQFQPAKNGLTVIGGKNNQGKTSVLDAIAWALGGEKFRPSDPQRDGSVLPPNLHIVMDNGLVVERKGKNSTLTVTDPQGKKGGQTLLNEFVEALALDLPKFMEVSGKEKAKTLLRIIGMEQEISELEEQEKHFYNERLFVGRTMEQKEKYAAEQVFYPDVPTEPVSPSELIKEQQEILARNGENQRKRDHAAELERKADQLERELSAAYGQAAEIEKKLNQLKEAYNDAVRDKEIAFRTAAELQDESTAELEASIASIDEINRKVRANLDKEKAEDDAKQYRDQYNQLTAEIEDVRKKKMDLLQHADLPLPELSVKDGELIYKGQMWDNMSSSEQLKVATAIVRKLNPKCGFVLLDKLEQMDVDTLQEFGKWLEQEGLQAIATRVSTGDECSIIIEDGMVASAQDPEPQKTFTSKSWEGGF